MDNNIDGLDGPVQGNLNVLSKEDEKGQRKCFSATKQIWSLSQLVKTAYEGDPNATELEVAVDANVLDLCLQYLVHRNGVVAPSIEKPLRSKIMRDVCQVYMCIFCVLFLLLVTQTKRHFFF